MKPAVMLLCGLLLLAPVFADAQEPTMSASAYRSQVWNDIWSNASYWDRNCKEHRTCDGRWDTIRGRCYRLPCKQRWHVAGATNPYDGTWGNPPVYPTAKGHLDPPQYRRLAVQHVRDIWLIRP